MTHKAFVYGTLKGMHTMYPSANQLAALALTKDKYVLYNGGFPSCRNDEFFPELRGQVTGELYDVDDDTLAQLDRYEGHPGHFERQKITILLPLDDGSQQPLDDVWMYFGPPNTHVHRDPITPKADGTVTWPVEHL